MELTSTSPKPQGYWMGGEEGRHVVIQFSLSKARSLNPPLEETLVVSLVRYYILLVRVVANSHSQSDKLVSTLDGGPWKPRPRVVSGYFSFCSISLDPAAAGIFGLFSFTSSCCFYDKRCPKR